MASHHHHHLHHCQTQPPCPTSTCCHSHCCTQPHLPPPPQPSHPQSPIDPLLQTLVSLLQQQQQPNVYSLHQEKPHTPKYHHHTAHFQQKNVHFQQDHPQQDVLSSLLQRINTLESSLHHFSASSSTIYRHHHSHSLRDKAARVIQTHFRAFLVHRSRTLRQLKELAFIKTSFNSLKSSVSRKTLFDFDVVSHKVMNLLLKLDSIQGGDLMIRDGKRSVSRDLMRFLEFVDGLAVKRYGLPNKSSRNVRFAGNIDKSRVLKGNDTYRPLTRNQKEILENLRDRVEKISGFSRVCEDDKEDVEFEGFQQFIYDDGDEEDENHKFYANESSVVSKIRNEALATRNCGQPRAKKSVSFSENGNVYRIFSDSHESISNGEGSFTDGSDSSGDHGEVVENPYESNEEARLDDGGPVGSSGGERHPRENLRRGGVDYNINCRSMDADGNLVFSAPLPVHMESRADLMKRKDVKIVE